MEDMFSAASQNASLHPSPHDHLLLCTQVSPFSGQLAPHPLSPPPSDAQGVGMQASTLPCADDPTVVQPSQVEPVDSPDRGEQSIPHAPTTKQNRREKRASHVAGRGAGGGGKGAARH